MGALRNHAYMHQNSIVIKLWFIKLVLNYYGKEQNVCNYFECVLVVA